MKDKITILFYPDRLDNPKKFSRVWRILKGVDWVNFHNDPNKPYDLHIFWSYTRHSIKPDNLTLTDKNVINRGCWDINKNKVHDVFNDYRVDPTTYKSVCVEKNNLQCGHQHHGLVECPIKPKDGYIYEKYMEDKEDGYNIRYRIYYMDGITHVAKRYEKMLFVTSTEKVEFLSKEEIFTPEEELDFINKCKLFGVDFGEIDILIDRGKLVVIDVNNVVSGNHPLILAESQEYKEIDNTFLNFIKTKFYEQETH